MMTQKFHEPFSPTILETTVTEVSLISLTMYLMIFCLVIQRVRSGIGHTSLLAK